ncbi:MAG: hypothetical protein ACFBWO_06730 [Paracoccaceae bacterium]
MTGAPAPKADSFDDAASTAAGRALGDAPEGADLTRLATLSREIVALKRVRSAQNADLSVPAAGFVRAWAAFSAEADAEALARGAVAETLAATVMGALDRAALRAMGRGADETRAVLQRAAAEAAGRFGLDPALAEIPAAEPAPLTELLESAPPFVALLVAQPRSGATFPGRPRLALEPAESHAEHCQSVAVIAALLCLANGTGPGEAWVMGLAHHLHNAEMPDGGFGGEEALGEHLAPLMARLTDRAIASLSVETGAVVASALARKDDVDAPSAAAFNAADVFDRVLQQESYARDARFELREALEDLDLVHPGPLQAFQQDVLARAGLWPAP